MHGFVNSGLAFMLNSYLQSSGYTIPKDISVICFDETEFTRMAIPQLTNIATDLQFIVASWRFEQSSIESPIPKSQSSISKSFRKH